MTNQDVIKNMEDVWGMKKGYAKNPVAVRKFDEVATKLNSAGITELTPDNREKFEKLQENILETDMIKQVQSLGGIIDPKKFQMIIL